MAWELADGLKAKRALVTGAGGGIGREVACALAAAGSLVYCTDVRAEPLGITMAAMDHGSRHASSVADLQDVEAISELVRAAVHALGGLDVLAHVAGFVTRIAQLADVTEHDWDIHQQTNLKGTFFLNKAVAEVLIAQGVGGRIINFSSQGWWTGGFEGSVVYNTMKGGIVTMTRGLARTLGPHSITVNSVAPGLVDTPMLMDGLPEALLKDLLAQTPLGRVAQPREIAGTVLFLASDHAAYISGATINVSGGFLMY